MNTEKNNIKMVSINEQIAKKSNDLNSFREYEYGSTTDWHNSIIEIGREKIENHKKQVDVSFHEKINRNFLRYVNLYASNINKENSIRANYPSVMIVGNANFDNEKKEKQNNAYDKIMIDRIRIDDILSKILTFGTSGAIRSTDENAIEKIQAEITELQEKHTSLPKNSYHKGRNLRKIKHLEIRIKEIDAMKNRDAENVFKSDNFKVIEDKKEMVLYGLQKIQHGKDF